MSHADWQQDDLARQAAAIRADLRAYQAAIAELERELPIADAAEAAFRADVAALRRQQADCRRRPYVRQLDEEGFEQFGPSEEARREYDRLQDAILAREAEYRRWVAARSVEIRNGPVATSWSPRDPIGTRHRLDRLRVGAVVLANRLAEVEAELTPGQALLSGAPSPAYVDHRAAVERLRAQIGGAP